MGNTLVRTHGHTVLLKICFAQFGKLELVITLWGVHSEEIFLNSCKESEQGYLSSYLGLQKVRNIYIWIYNPYNKSIKWKWCLCKDSNAIGKGLQFHVKLENDSTTLCGWVFWAEKIWGQGNVCAGQRRGTRGTVERLRMAVWVWHLSWRLGKRRFWACGSTLRESQPGHQRALVLRLLVEESHMETKVQVLVPIAVLSLGQSCLWRVSLSSPLADVKEVSVCWLHALNMLFLEGRSDCLFPHHCRNYLWPCHFEKDKKREWQKGKGKRERGGK